MRFQLLLNCLASVCSNLKKLLLHLMLFCAFKIASIQAFEQNAAVTDCSFFVEHVDHIPYNYLLLTARLNSAALNAQSDSMNNVALERSLKSLTEAIESSSLSVEWDYYSAFGALKLALPATELIDKNGKKLETAAGLKLCCFDPESFARCWIKMEDLDLFKNLVSKNPNFSWEIEGCRIENIDLIKALAKNKLITQAEHQAKMLAESLNCEFSHFKKINFHDPVFNATLVQGMVLNFHPGLLQNREIKSVTCPIHSAMLQHKLECIAIFVPKN